MIEGAITRRGCIENTKDLFVRGGLVLALIIFATLFFGGPPKLLSFVFVVLFGAFLVGVTFGILRGWLHPVAIGLAKIFCIGISGFMTAPLSSLWSAVETNYVQTTTVALGLPAAVLTYFLVGKFRQGSKPIEKVLFSLNSVLIAFSVAVGSAFFISLPRLWE